MKEKEAVTVLLQISERPRKLYPPNELWMTGVVAIVSVELVVLVGRRGNQSVDGDGRDACVL